MNDKQKEIQRYLKSIKASRRDVELAKERCRTYELIYDGKGAEYKRLKAEIKDKQDDLISHIDRAQKLIDKLPDVAEREVLSLYYVDCLTMPQIADKMFYRENTLWIKHSKALQHLFEIKQSMEIK